jgi:hypothetical protein
MPAPISKILSVIVIATWAPAALAQTDVAKQVQASVEAAWSKAHKACQEDKYCGSVTPGEGRMVLCMLAHDDKISGRCVNALFDLAGSVKLTISNVVRAAAACQQEVGTVCSQSEAGSGQIAQCLIDKQAELSPACRAEVTGLQARMKK